MLFKINCIEVLLLLPLLPPVNLHRYGKSRIVGGTETTIDQVPYLVNLRRNGQFTCGGSMITHKCVLTAAHCVYGIPAASLTINAGTSKLTEEGVKRQVQQTFLSAFYSPNNLDMDVAVLKLNESLRGANIATIPLCSNQLASKDFVQVSGWGTTSETSQLPSNQVRTANVQVITRLECASLYAGKAYISSTMFCASVAGVRDSCSGDSGGPVVYKGQVCGIVSWGFGCGRSEFPGVYTNVASLRISAFLKTIVMQNCF